MATPAAFISYSREDSEFALRLAQDLKAAGAAVWLDQLDIKPGHPWDNAIEDALMDAPQMLVVLSPSSARSPSVRDEISFALEAGKIIVPVLYMDCVVPLRLQRTQRIDFRTDYTRGLTSLLDQLRVMTPNQSVIDHAAEAEAKRQAAWEAREAHRLRQEYEAREAETRAIKERESEARRQKEEAEQRSLEETKRSAGAAAQAEAARKAREEAERIAKEKAEQQEAEEAARKAKAEADALRLVEERRTRLAAETELRRQERDAEREELRKEQECKSAEAEKLKIQKEYERKAALLQPPSALHSGPYLSASYPQSASLETTEEISASGIESPFSGLQTWHIGVAIAFILGILVLVHVVAFSSDSQYVSPQIGCEQNNGGACDAVESGGESDMNAKSPVEALPLFQLACNHDGYKKGLACQELGDIYAKGDGVPQDFGKAINAYNAACFGDDPQFGCLQLGDLYYAGKGVSKDVGQAVTLYRKGCDALYEYSHLACSVLGILYANGDGVNQDRGTARNLFVKACPDNNQNWDYLDWTCIYLQTFDYGAQSVPRDVDQIADYYQKQCELNAELGCAYLAHMYKAGFGVNADPGKAETLSQKALALSKKGCSKGTINACIHAGNFFHVPTQNGLSSHIDDTKAKEYYQRACDLGSQSTCDFIKKYMN